MLETPDLSKFGRSDQLHAALLGICSFVKAHKKYPENNKEDIDETLKLAKETMEANKKASEDNFSCDIEEDVFTKAVQFSSCSISPIAAFYGGIVAQEIVKFTGKYSPLKQWLHFDIYETLPREQVDRTPMNCRYDD